MRDLLLWGLIAAVIGFAFVYLIYFQ